MSGMPHWTLWAKQLISVGVANGVPPAKMARAFGVSRSAMIGLIWRMHQDPKVKGLRAYPPNIYTQQITLRVDVEMLAEIDARRGKRSRAAMVRDLIEWGLEA